MKPTFSWLPIALFLILVTSPGCYFLTTEVPAGYVGMVMTPDGLTGESLQPGRHRCYFRDRMYLIEMKEEVVSEPLSILCADDLNFKFDLKVRAKLKTADTNGIMDLFNRKGANMKPMSVGGGNARVLGFETLYQTYVQPQARSIARGVVSKFATTEIRENREKIQQDIFERLEKAMQETPMEVPVVAASNFDYPKVITDAVEKRRKREIEIGEEKAKQAMELLRAENRMKLAERMKQVRQTEAEAEAIYYQIVGKALNKSYLQLRELENVRELYSRVSQGDKVIITGEGATMPIINTSK